MRTVRLNERDLEVLGWIAAQRVASLDDLSVVLGRRLGAEVAVAASSDGKSAAETGDWGRRMKPAGVQRVVKRWTDAGVVERWKPLTAYPALCRLTPEGSALLGVRGTRRPGVGNIAHALAVNRLRLQVEAEASQAWTWLGETEITEKFEIETGRDHLPDAVLMPSGAAVSDADSCVAVEVERNGKGRARWARILRESLGKWGNVWYVCSDAALQDRVMSVADDHGAKGARLAVADRERLVSSVAGDPLPREIQHGSAGRTYALQEDDLAMLLAE